MDNSQEDQNDTVTLYRGYLVIHPNPNSIAWHRDFWVVRYRHCETPCNFKEEVFQSWEEAYAFSTVPLEFYRTELDAAFEAFSLLSADGTRNLDVPYTLVLQAEVVGRNSNVFLARKPYRFRDF